MSEKALRPPAFLVLTALAGHPQHGYAVIEDVLRISGGSVRLHTGTLYALLDRLREAGLVEVDREEIVASRLRRYYRLTDAGAARLSARRRRCSATPAPPWPAGPTPARGRGRPGMTRLRPSRRPAQERLERRYQRLMASYPASYRAANAEEMIGVALSGAAPWAALAQPG